MKHEVVLISKDGLGGWLKETLLAGSDFRVHSASDFGTGLQLLCKHDCELFVVEDAAREGNLPQFLSQVRSSVHVSGLKGIVLSGSDDISLRQPPVQWVLPLPPDPSAFDQTLAMSLHIKSRSTRHYLVRMTQNGSSGSGKVLGTMVSIHLSESNILLESVKPLPLGRRYIWGIAGVKELQGLGIPGSIWKEEPNRGLGLLRRYTVRFDEEAREERAALGAYLRGAG